MAKIAGITNFSKFYFYKEKSKLTVIHLTAMIVH